MDSDAGPDDRYLTLAEFAAEVGAHPNTVRKLLREGEVPYTVEDLATGERVSPEALRPNKFRYMVPASAIQHVAATIHEPVRSSGKVAGGGHSEPTARTLQGPDESTHKLRADVARLEAENALLREHNTFLQDLTERLLPMLPPGPNTTSQAGEVAPEPDEADLERLRQELAERERRGWWRRLFGSRGGDRVSDRERSEFAARLVGDLQLRLTPRLIADARGEEPFSGNDFMPLADAAAYYGVSERQVWTWLDRGVIAGFRFRSAGLEYNGRHIRPRVYWMVRAHPELRRENEEVNLAEVAREVVGRWGWEIGGAFSPPVSRRLLRAWARGRPIKDPRHRRYLLDLWNGDAVFEAKGRGDRTEA